MKIYVVMGDVFPVIAFEEKEDAEQYCKENGFIDEPFEIKLHPPKLKEVSPGIFVVPKSNSIFKK